MRRKLPAELLGRPSPEETSAKGRNAAQPPHFADLGSSTFRRDLVLQAARRTAPAVALVPGNLLVPTDISAPAFGAAARPVACRPSIRLRRVPAGRRLLQRTERSTDRRDFAHARRYEHLLNKCGARRAPSRRTRSSAGRRAFRVRTWARRCEKWSAGRLLLERGWMLGRCCAGLTKNVQTVGAARVRPQRLWADTEAALVTSS